MSAPLFIVKARWGSGPASSAHYCTTWATAIDAAHHEHLRMKDANADSDWLWDGMSYPTQGGEGTRVATWVWIEARKLTTSGDVPNAEVVAR